MNLNQFEIVVNVVSAITIMILIFTHRKGTTDAVQKALDGAQVATKTLEHLVAGTPLAPYVNVLDEIEKAAIKGVQAAQQMHKEDKTVDRAQFALDYVHNALAELGIELTERVQKLVEGAINAAVYVLEPSETGKATDESTAEDEPTPVPQPVIPDHVQKLMQAASDFAAAAVQSDTVAPAVDAANVPTNASSQAALQSAR